MVQLVQTEGEFRTSSATSAITLGWAKHSPEKAISLAEQSSPFDWKSATPTWTALDHVDWWHSSRSDTESFALSRWLDFRSKEALSDLFEQEDITLNYYYIGILAQKFPDEIKGMVNRLPTGTKKRKILAAIEYAKENHSEIHKFFSLASPEETLGGSRFPKLVEQASKAQKKEFPEWLTDYRLTHLQSQEVQLIRGIIKDRWEVMDPEALVRFQVKHCSGESITGLETWWRRAPQAATAFVIESSRKDLWEHLLYAVAGKDTGAALALFENHAQEVLTNPREFFATLAAKDRESFLAYALTLKDEAKKTDLLAILAWARMHFDFDWVVETQNRYEANPFVGIPEISYLGHIPIFHEFNSGEVIYDLLDRMPKNWKRKFLESYCFARGDAMRWLSAEEHPALSNGELRNLQKRLGNEPYWVDRRDIPAMRALLEKAHWLSKQTKSELATWAVIRSRNPESLREWVLSLPPEVNSEALVALKEFRELKKEDAKRSKAPTLSNIRKLSEIEAYRHGGRSLDMEEWTGPEMQSFHNEIKALTPDNALKLFTTIDTNQLPWRMRASLVSRILASENFVANVPIRFLIKETAKEFAKNEPANASKWTMSLPHEGLRVFAAGFVAAEWKEQNPEEAENWVLTLPKQMQERFGY